MIVPGGGFLLPLSRVRGGGVVSMKLILALPVYNYPLASFLWGTAWAYIYCFGYRSREISLPDYMSSFENCHYSMLIDSLPMHVVKLK